MRTAAKSAPSSALFELYTNCMLLLCSTFLALIALGICLVLYSLGVTLRHWPRFYLDDPTNEGPLTALCTALSWLVYRYVMKPWYRRQNGPKNWAEHGQRLAEIERADRRRFRSR